MSVTFGFYNSHDNDRLYNAIQMSSIFDGVINDGVYPAYGGHLVVVPGTGMDVVVSSGRAWFNHTWTYNDSDLVLTVGNAEVEYDRIDIVILEVDARDDVRDNSIKIIPGTPNPNPVAPTLDNGDMIHQYPLAYIHVAGGVTEIVSGDITSKIGTTDCPWVTGVVNDSILDSPGTAGNVLTSTGSQWESRAPKINVDPGAVGNVLTSTGTAWASSPPTANIDYDQLHAEIS